MILSEAQAIAERVRAELRPYCERAEIAGSVRRKKPDVGDLELVVVPKSIPSGLFQDMAVRDPGFVKTVGQWFAIKGNAWNGKYTQVVLPDGINLDLFMPDKPDFWRQFVIRTGSAEYVRKEIASGWRQKGWCGSNAGLRKISDCIEIEKGGKKGWKCININAEIPPVWDSEIDFYRWLGKKYIEPEGRM